MVLLDHKIGFDNDHDGAEVSLSDVLTSKYGT